MADAKHRLENEREPTLAEREATNRVLAAMDGFADQWELECNIASYADRLVSNPEAREKFTAWSKQCFSEGAYRGYVEAKATAQEHFIAPLIEALEGLLELGPNHCHTSSTIEKVREIEASCSTCSPQIAARAAIAKAKGAA